MLTDDGGLVKRQFSLGFLRFNDGSNGFASPFPKPIPFSVLKRRSGFVKVHPIRQLHENLTASFRPEVMTSRQPFASENRIRPNVVPTPEMERFHLPFRYRKSLPRLRRPLRTKQRPGTRQRPSSQLTTTSAFKSVQFCHNHR